VLYSLLADKYWVSITTFTADEKGLGGMDLTSGISSIGFGGIANAFNFSNPGQDFLNIMRSRSFREMAIEHFELLKYFEIEETDILKSMDLALKAMKELVQVDYSMDTNIISVKVESKDKQLSKELCNYYRDAAHQQLKLQQKAKNQEEYLFMKERLTDYEMIYENLLEKLREFQEKNKFISIDSNHRVLLESYSELVARSLTNEIEYELVQDNYSPETPYYQKAKIKFERIKEKVEEFESEKGISNGKYLIGLENLPELNSEYMKLYLDMQVYEKVSMRLYPLMEAAKYKYLKENDLIYILDEAREAGLRSKPRRAILVLSITIISFLLLCLVIIVIDSMKKEEKWNQFWSKLWGKN
jgi:capsule polysaccharide export protein KpsE/RkpR